MRQIKFAIVGVLNTLVDFVVFNLLAGLFGFSVFGFGLTFLTLFNNTSAFGTVSSTMLTMFTAFLNQYDFHEMFLEVDLLHRVVGTILFFIYLVFSVIVVFNLVIARMSVRTSS